MVTSRDASLPWRRWGTTGGEAGPHPSSVQLRNGVSLYLFPGGRQAVRPTERGAGKGGGSKRRPRCHGVDRETIPRESGLTSRWSCGTRKSGQPLEEAKQMSAAATLAGAAAPGTRKRLWVSSVQVRQPRLTHRVLRGAFARLKRHAWTRARAVSRGGGGGNATSLPDHKPSKF